MRASLMETMVVPFAVGPRAENRRRAQVRECIGSGGRYDGGMANRPDDLPPGSAVVVTNPDEDCSPEAFHALLDDLLAGPEPELESLDAAEALRELRVDAEA
jgi:hypothetical protein